LAQRVFRAVANGSLQEWVGADFTGFRPAVGLIDICKEEVQAQEHFREKQEAISNYFQIPQKS
jgi:hypothetical protein